MCAQSCEIVLLFLILQTVRGHLRQLFQAHLLRAGRGPGVSGPNVPVRGRQVEAADRPQPDGPQLGRREGLLLPGPPRLCGRGGPLQGPTQLQGHPRSSGTLLSVVMRFTFVT